MSRAAGIATLLLAAACGAGPTERAAAASILPSTPEALSSRGRALAVAGQHGRAAAYYEAALDAGGGERRILPPLVASLIRAGELRRALPPLARMRAIWPDDPALPALTATIRALLGDGGALARDGGDR
jgi:hypothetical protein